MTFSGYLVSAKALSLWGVVAAGTAGNLAGSLAAYALGAYGGLPFLRRHGRKILISPHDLDRAHAWFVRHGQAAVFIGRLLPILRTFISLPAGVARMPLAPFVAYSAAGAAIWCAALAWAGLRLGQHWQAIAPYMHAIDYGVAAGLAVFLALAVRRHRAGRTDPQPPIPGSGHGPGRGIRKSSDTGR